MPDNTIDVSGEGLYEHHVGNEYCTTGWCGETFPRPHWEDFYCTGLVHADFGDESSDGDYWLHTKCDECGETNI